VGSGRVTAHAQRLAPRRLQSLIHINVCLPPCSPSGRRTLQTYSSLPELRQTNATLMKSRRLTRPFVGSCEQSLRKAISPLDFRTGSIPSEMSLAWPLIDGLPVSFSSLLPLGKASLAALAMPGDCFADLFSAHHVTQWITLSRKNFRARCGTGGPQSHLFPTSNEQEKEFAERKCCTTRQSRCRKHRM
jgi:hypothetical protein